MAETILKSPGITTKELDLSAPGSVRPQGIPAGIIGTAQSGPAFVPVVFATQNDFNNLFGITEGKHFGAMAVREWMRNARSGLYLRVLGAGNAAAAATNGTTSNAGFAVGQSLINYALTTLETDGAARLPVANPEAGAARQASVVITIADAVAINSGDSSAYWLRLTMYGDAAGEQYDLHVSHGDVFANTSTTWTNDGDNTYSAELLTYGGGPRPTDAQVATALATLYSSITGYTATAVAGGVGTDSTVTITADAGVVSTYDIAAASAQGDKLAAFTIGTPVTGITADTGSTYFLSVGMFNSAGEQDYLGTAIANGTKKQILRGVLMFPSGVVPGLQYDSATTTIAPIAWGSYATNKDGGSDIGDLYNSTTFKMVLNGFSSSTGVNEYMTASFDPTSPIYFPKVMNTDASKIQEKGHYLYGHYDIPAGLASLTTTTDDSVYLNRTMHRYNIEAGTRTIDNFNVTSSTYTPNYDNWRSKFTHAFTPWIKSQKLGSSRKKLFRFHMLDAGVGGHNVVKIAIANIQKSMDTSSLYGSFDVQIRAASDSDKKPVVLQKFSRLNLNPSSDRYIARVIGDQNTYFDFERGDGKQKLVTEGLYPNKSQYVRVQVMANVEAGSVSASALPVGFAGKHHLVLDGKALRLEDRQGVVVSTFAPCFEPPIPLRQTVSIGTGSTRTVDADYYWGTQYSDVSSSTERNKDTKVRSLINNLTKWYPTMGGSVAAGWIGDNANAVATAAGEVQDADAYNNNEFSLENVWIRTALTSAGAVDLTNSVDATMWHEAVYIRKGYAGRPTGLTEAGGSTFYQSVENGPGADKDKDGAGNGYRYLDVATDFGQQASKRFFKFTIPMQGGFDGLDIFDREKADMSSISAFREMSSNSSSTLGGTSGPTTAAFRKGLDILAERSDVDCQILATPGMRDAGICDYAIDKTEDRFDALYIMDTPVYDHDGKLVTKSTQETSVSQTAQKLSDRNLDTSFAAAYFPDVVLKENGTMVQVPPSVPVIGALSLNDALAHPWYAPAGFARGALPTTVETAVKLNRPNMDVLYESDINPITSFPQSADSVVIFGQKTLLQAQSALDRVNVRRLLIDVRRKVRTVANTILFEPNRESTLARFSSLVNPILGRIQAQQGLDRYKVVIDTTTTTQQDVENNTIRGKIFLQPTRSIEFISLDFVVTNAGAEI